MIRPLTVETVCFEILLASLSAALAAWIWGMVRRSFGAIPAVLWLVLSCVSLVCAAMIGLLEFSRR
ncbi:MAG: hypothetical protein ACHP7J_05310 [Terriglobales bacterium]